MRVTGKLFHTGLVAQDTSFRPFTTRVDGQYSDFMSLAGEIFSETFDESTLAGSRYTRDTDPYRPSGGGQATVDHFLGNGLVLGLGTFYQRDRLA